MKSAPDQINTILGGVELKGIWYSISQNLYSFQWFILLWFLLLCHFSHLLFVNSHPTFTTGESFFKSDRRERKQIRLKPSANMHFCENQHQQHLATDIINKKAEGKLRPHRHGCRYKTVALRSVQRLGEDNPRNTWTQKPNVLYVWEMCMRSLSKIHQHSGT